MKKLICFLSVFLISSTAFAETGNLSRFICTGNALSENEGQRVLNSAQSAYSNLGSMNSYFKQVSYMAAMDLSESSSGSVWFKKPGRMKWEYTQPDQQSFVVRDETVWFYQKELSQVTVSNFRDILISDAPVAFLMGLGDLKEEFLLQKACAGSETILELTPKKGHEGNLKSFSLIVDNQMYLPLGAQIVDIGGNKTEIYFINTQFNQAINEAVFSSNFPRGTDVNDQRKHS